MKDQEINEEIALQCGWSTNLNRERWWYEGWPPESNSVDEPPDYCNDLNAMHEAEKTLPDFTEDGLVNKVHYHRHIVELCRHKDKTGAFGHELIMATARQRAEAFLKTKGLWED